VFFFQLPGDFSVFSLTKKTKATPKTKHFSRDSREISERPRSKNFRMMNINQNGKQMVEMSEDGAINSAEEKTLMFSFPFEEAKTRRESFFGKTILYYYRIFVRLGSRGRDLRAKLIQKQITNFLSQ
jgi:hypothetical protein